MKPKEKIKANRTQILQEVPISVKDRTFSHQQVPPDQFLLISWQEKAGPTGVCGREELGLTSFEFDEVEV